MRRIDRDHATGLELEVAVDVSAPPVRRAIETAPPALKIDASVGNQIIVGTGSDDVILSDGGFDVILAEGGDDVITATSKTQEVFVHGGAGNDEVRVECYFLRAIGGEGSDTLVASWYGQLWGGSAVPSISWDGIDTPNYSDMVVGFDDLVDDGVKDILVGGGSAGDRIYVGRYDQANGGGGSYNLATAVFSGFKQGVTLDLGGDDAIQRAAEALEATMIGFTSVSFIGTAFADTVTIGDLVGTVDAGAGDDRLTSVSTRYTNMDGGAGADVLIAGSDGGHLYGGDYRNPHDRAVDRLIGGAGTDYGHLSYGDRFDGNGGVDEAHIDFGWRASGLSLDLRIDMIERLEREAGVTLVDVERFRVLGTDFADLIHVGDAYHVEGGFGDDRLIGDAGDDSLQGGMGDDVMIGGGGSDSFYGDIGDDTVVFAGKSTDYKIEEVFANTFYVTTLLGDPVLSAVHGVEVLKFDDKTIRIGDEGPLKTLFEGTDGVDYLHSFVRSPTDEVTLRGFDGDDWLQGDIGRDTLDGGSGADVMAGGDGDDRYIVENPNDRIWETRDGGVDTVFSAIHFSLLNTRSVENITLTGKGNYNARGDDGANVLTGNAGRNILTGGKGDDTYVIQSADDQVVELKGEGTDTLVAGFSLSLAGRYVENLTLTGSTALNATGNSLDNVLTGNAGINVLTGGTGDDTYVVQTAGDRVVEATGAGDDHVLSSINFSLAGQYIERLTLTGTAKYGAGNSLANTIAGNAANNVLDGGKGADTMAGGGGHDRYLVDNALDKVVEKDGEGSDLVVSSVSYSLAGTYVERLELTGSAALNATGNSLDNVLTGNAGANRLEGGKGADTLIGGAGGDYYLYRAASDSTVAKSDTITELGFGDRLDLSLIDANASLAGNQAFALVDAFSGARGQATLTYDAGTKFSTLLFDLDGDRTADMRILIGGDANEARIVW